MLSKEPTTTHYYPGSQGKGKWNGKAKKKKKMGELKKKKKRFIFVSELIIINAIVIVNLCFLQPRFFSILKVCVGVFFFSLLFISAYRSFHRTRCTRICHLLDTTCCSFFIHSVVIHFLNWRWFFLQSNKKKTKMKHKQ